MANQPSTLVVLELKHARVASVEGEIDLATAAGFEHALLRALAVDDLIIDLRLCTYLDSAGICAIVKVRREAQASEREIALVAPAEPARRMLELTKLDEAIPTFEDRGGAVAALGAAR